MQGRHIPSNLQALGLDGILIINVRSFVERRKHIEAQLARFGMTGELVHEFDADDIDPETDRAYFKGEGLRPAQKSCSLKHIVALERIRQRGWRRALVLEDDAVLSDAFLAGLAQALEEAGSHAGPHVIYLGCGGNQYTPRSKRVAGQYLYRNCRGRLTDSYLLGAAAAGLRLEWMARNPTELPIDLAFDKMDHEMGIAILWFEDPLVEQGSKNGAFRNTLEPVARPPVVQRVHFHWKKLWQKRLRQLWR
ncbi:glycosyltransferase family 25 protein [Cupriavidus basilensis]|uniref:Glycosyltransferase family 25 protein n=1 Tax=Cupriavidus basilensis TaxID=68895 RepID=A0ABT6ANV7_9BURK|nr:glycosyltransferase family 25 protein [Cupriavidus basilensis]MDF3834306.1 glycosyltransferase family 25 protein [Cupriavidus basilensis]